MDLFYLKDSPFEGKSASKRSKFLNAPKHLLTTNPVTKSSVIQKSLKFMPTDLPSPRIFKEPSLSENTEHLKKLNQIQEQLLKLSQYKHLIIESQGQSDELKSRIIEKESHLCEVAEANSNLRCNLQSYTDFMNSEIDSTKFDLVQNKNELSNKLLKKDSTKQIISSLVKDLQTEELKSDQLEQLRQTSLKEVQNLQTHIQVKRVDQENRSAEIQRLLESSRALHSLFLQDEESKLKLNEKIIKFQQIRKN